MTNISGAQVENNKIRTVHISEMLRCALTNSSSSFLRRFIRSKGTLTFEKYPFLKELGLKAENDGTFNSCLI